MDVFEAIATTVLHNNYEIFKIISLVIKGVRNHRIHTCTHVRVFMTKNINSSQCDSYTHCIAKAGIQQLYIYLHAHDYIVFQRMHACGFPALLNSQTRTTFANAATNANIVIRPSPTRLMIPASTTPPPTTPSHISPASTSHVAIL